MLFSKYLEPESYRMNITRWPIVYEIEMKSMMLIKYLWIGISYLEKPKDRNSLTVFTVNQ